MMENVQCNFSYDFFFVRNDKLYDSASDFCFNEGVLFTFFDVQTWWTWQLIDHISFKKACMKSEICYCIDSAIVKTNNFYVRLILK